MTRPQSYAQLAQLPGQLLCETTTADKERHESCPHSGGAVLDNRLLRSVCTCTITNENSPCRHQDAELSRFLIDGQHLSCHCSGVPTTSVNSNVLPDQDPFPASTSLRLYRSIFHGEVPEPRSNRGRGNLTGTCSVVEGAKDGR